MMQTGYGSWLMALPAKNLKRKCLVASCFYGNKKDLIVITSRIKIHLKSKYGKYIDMPIQSLLRMK